MNAALGLTGEAGEVAELIKKATFHGRPDAEEGIAGELGDILYYLTVTATLYGYTLDDIMFLNHMKLQKRYPQGFEHGGGNR